MALLWLIVTQDFPPGFVGGVASWCEDLAAALHDAGEEVVDFMEKTREWEFASGDFVWDEESEYFVHYRKWDVGPDGRVYAAVKRNDFNYAISGIF